MTVMDLQQRLRNCLQTILEMESGLERLELGHTLLKEFEMLRDFIQKVDEVQLSEPEVQRIEAATERFLEELRGPMNLSGDDDRPGRYIH